MIAVRATAHQHAYAATGTPADAFGFQYLAKYIHLDVAHQDALRSAPIQLPSPEERD